ncbi:hypothetical protein QAD02_019324 [Eretmocerus hayati]|uniref:Uncharacterized protein n=1 Tax=Eretmocerus hayati TaxID=131215 RepID=A0ACC2PMG2_9HYME|nr:hypothetical protein QAD02_019324 [Eretmocerus hayati]
MSLNLTDANSFSFSSDRQTELEVTQMKSSSESVELATLTLNFRAIGLLEDSVTFVSQKVEEYENPNQGKIIIDSEINGQTRLSDGEEKKLPIISLAEVAWHDTSEDCWIVIYDYVYDCTNFMKNHPGGHDVLLEHAGRDATLSFIGTGHSKIAKRLLEKFLIGELPISERIFRVPNGIKIGDFV